MPLRQIASVARHIQHQSVLHSKRHHRRLAYRCGSERLHNVELGLWSMSSETLNFLESEIHRCRPDAVLEFGSGVSTACIARYMQDVHGAASRIYVHSFDQNLESIDKTRQLTD